MNIGKLDRFVTLQTEVNTQDNNGGYVTTWTTYKQVWASKIDNTGNEGMESGRDTTTTTTTFKIRYISGLNTSYRLVYNGVNYDIEVIKELGRREGQELKCISKYGDNNG